MPSFSRFYLSYLVSQADASRRLHCLRRDAWHIVNSPASADAAVATVMSAAALISNTPLVATATRQDRGRRTSSARFHSPFAHGIENRESFGGMEWICLSTRRNSCGPLLQSWLQLQLQRAPLIWFTASDGAFDISLVSRVSSSRQHPTGHRKDRCHRCAACLVGIVRPSASD